MGLRDVFKLRLMGKDAVTRMVKDAEVRATVEEREYREIEREQDAIVLGEASYASRLQEALATKVDELRITEDKYWLLLGQEEDVQRALPTEKLHNIQDACFNKYISDPHMQSIVNNVKQYVLGRGIKYDCLDPKAQAVLTAFWKANLMERRQKRMVKSEFIEGEYFLAYFADFNTGRVKVRKIPPKQITDIETHPEDLETKRAYERSYNVNGTPTTTWYADVDYLSQKSEGNGGTSKHEGELKEGCFVQFIKDGFEDETRGRPPCYAILKWLKLYEQLLLDGASRWHELAKVLFFKKVKSPRGDISTRAERAPKGGVTLIETEHKTYRTEAPKVAAGEADTIGKMLLHRIGAGQTIPLYILDQDASNENYASIRKSDSPFSQMIIDRQDFWQIEFERMFRAVLWVNVEAKQLPEETKIKSYAVEVLIQVFDRINHRVIEGVEWQEVVGEIGKMLEGKKEKETNIRTVDLPISIVFPDVIHENPKEIAEVLKIHKELGLSSKATMAEKAGYNWQHELVRMAVERDQEKKQAEEALIDFTHGKDTDGEIDFDRLDLEEED